MIEEVSRNEMLSTIHYMTEHFPYRLAGSPCEAAASRYVTERLKQYGLEVENKEFYTYNSDPMYSKVTVLEPEMEIDSLPCAHIRATKPEGEIFELIYVGNGDYAAYQAGIHLRTVAMETLEAINRRYSCRRYDRSKLPEAAKIEILLHSAQVAPVACNKRDHIHISLISDLELLEAWDHAAACYVGAIKSHPLYHAPAVLLISVRPDASDPPENPYLNAGCAAENATLAATALGLGSVLLAMPVRALRKEEALLDRFALPDNFQPVIAVAFGYEQADPISRRKSLVSYKCNKASKEEDYNAMH